MPTATAAGTGRYTRREATGRIEEINDDGLKLNGVWWNKSRRQPIDLSTYHTNDGVYVCADETADGGRRFLTAIEPIQTARTAPPAPAAFVDDMPDDWPDDAQPSTFTAVQLAAHRLECLRIAASVLVPGWTKRNVEPDRAILLGEADALLDWLYLATD